MESEIIKQRYDLAIERIGEFGDCSDILPSYRDYFKNVSKFILMLHRVYSEDTFSREMSFDEMLFLNHSLYEDIKGEAYKKSYANPAVACEAFGLEMGRLLSVLYTEVRACIGYVFEKKLFDITIILELFIQVYCLFENEEAPAAKEVYDALYWHISDYSEETLAEFVNEQSDPSWDFALDILMNSDLTDLRYLFLYGEHISDNEIGMAKFLNSLDEAVIEKIADTFVGGYVRGFELAKKDLSKKGVCDLRYNVGFERVMRECVRKLDKSGLKCSVYRIAAGIINRNPHRIGYGSCPANPQYDYDHRQDIALFVDREFNERRLGVLRQAYENIKDQARLYAGPAVMEVFGEEVFEPEAKNCNIDYDEKTSKLYREYAAHKNVIVDEYVHLDERSFTIMAFPLPSIGERFEEIFADVVKLNTLDQDRYEVVQQKIIDILDGSEYVLVKGMNGNKTDLRVSLIDVSDKKKETKFENCLADVNIPLGEVFTSPKLKGTNGILNVKNVFLEGIGYKDLTLEFADGFIRDYSCANYDEEKSGKFIKQNILFNHDSLPMGEFAIGTNTLAYVTAKKYGIEKYMPILIAEKTGPHFAVGDTCYSHSEDIRVYNPNGKEIVAKDNEHTLMYRGKDDLKAYFNCHTDITIPYDELGLLTAVDSEGNKRDIVRDGRFVFEGCELLNEAFDE